MRKTTVRILAVLSVMLSLMVVFTIISDDNTSVSVDCKKYYYNQLKYDFEKDIYTKIKNIKDFEIDDEDSKSKCARFCVGIHDLHFFISSCVIEEIEYHVERAIQAARNDMPLNTYFFHGYSFDLYHFSIFGWPLFLMEIKLSVADDYNEKTKEWYDQQIIHHMDNTPINIDELAKIPDKIIKIHKYVLSTLSYDNDNCDIDSSDDKSYNIVNRISSVYNALVGDHKVVCEGYAKMFKVLCDKYDIPCIIVTSEETKDSDGRQQGGHMWNYVCVDNLWYIVDCTWDDRKYENIAIVETDFLMSGVDMFHKPSNNMNFEVPALSLNKYGNFVTFMSGDVELFETVAKHGIISEPPIPEETGRTFMYWYLSDENKPFDFGLPVKNNWALKARWAET